MAKNAEKPSKAKKTKSTSKAKRITSTTEGSAKAGLKSVDDRNDHRIPIQLLVDYKADGHYLFDFCRDLGTGGVFIQTKAPLPKGSRIDLTFTIPDSKETLRTSGEVIWVQQDLSGRADSPAGMGVQFSKFCDTQRRMLQDFVSRYHGERHRPAVQEKKPA